MPTRKPSPSEHEFFFNNRGVPGYAAPDNRVVFNPFTMMDERVRKAIMANGMARIAMRTGVIPQYGGGLTPTQRMGLDSNPHYQNAPKQDRVDTSMARLASGDPSAGKGSKAQQEYVKRLLLTIRGMR